MWLTFETYAFPNLFGNSWTVISSMIMYIVYTLGQAKGPQSRQSAKRFSNEGTYTVVLYIYKYFVQGTIEENQGPIPPSSILNPLQTPRSFSDPWHYRETGYDGLPDSRLQQLSQSDTFASIAERILWKWSLDFPLCILSRWIGPWKEPVYHGRMKTTNP